MQRHVDIDGETKKKATAELFRRHAPAMLTFLRQHMSSREDAEDLLLEVFAAVLEQKQLNVIRMTETEQRLWLWRVVRNKMIDVYRKNVRRSSTTLEHVADELFVEKEQTPEYVALRTEEYARLHAALQQLSPLQREILTLRFVKNMRSAEVASVLGKSDGAVRMILSRTLNFLRTLYSDKNKDKEDR
jgi:RNA polymerase sigma factor (sigma-70 family)